jgi:hypothetical protein
LLRTAEPIAVPAGERVVIEAEALVSAGGTLEAGASCGPQWGAITASAVAASALAARAAARRSWLNDLGLGLTAEVPS